jgi:ATP-dependent Lon protease
MLAAKRAGITDIILSEENKKDIDEIKNDYIKGIKFHYVKEMIDVTKLSLLKEKVKDAIDLTVVEQSSNGKLL